MLCGIDVFSRGKPWLDGYCKSLNGTLRDKLLNRDVSCGLAEARPVARCRLR